MREIEQRNSVCLAAWRARMATMETCPDPWPEITRAWFNRRLCAQRLAARFWMASLRRLPAVPIAHARRQKRHVEVLRNGAGVTFLTMVRN